MNGDSDELILAPDNFAMVESGVYRSAFPRSKNFSFLKSLNLKTVIPLVPEEIPDGLHEFYIQNNITVKQHGLDGNKYPFKELSMHDVSMIFMDILDPKNHPTLIHCNKGKHRTGSVIGCLRKVRGWGLSSIFTEYYMFAAPKARFEDQIFIESYDVSSVSTLVTGILSKTCVEKVDDDNIKVTDNDNDNMAANSNVDPTTIDTSLVSRVANDNITDDNSKMMDELLPHHILLES